jgi:predicted GNAT superfamily acetyltransferase
VAQIVRLNSTEQLKRCEEVQEKIWGSDPIPYTLLRAIQDSGGLVLGAYDDRGEMIGVLVGFLGMKEGRLVHYSHICGVVEEARFRDVGFQLKSEQRRFALSQGLDLVVWTFDPLQGANAYFNLHKLGAVARRYLRNYYGLMEDRLNAGMESDRLLAEWWIRSGRVEASLRGERPFRSVGQLLEQGAELATVTEEVAPGLRRLASHALGLKAGALLIEIPESINAIKQRDLGLAIEWRNRTRELFEHYLSRGYVATDLISEKQGEGRRNFYLLERGFRLEG